MEGSCGDWKTGIWDGGKRLGGRGDQSDEWERQLDLEISGSGEGRIV